MIELNVALDKSFVEASCTPPAGKTRSSVLVGFPDGAVLPTQFVGFDQFGVAPIPDHVNVAGASRDSSNSNLNVGNGRNNDGLRVRRDLRTEGIMTPTEIVV